jgi:hypothetical protein
MIWCKTWNFSWWRFLFACYKILTFYLIIKIVTSLCYSITRSKFSIVIFLILFFTFEGIIWYILIFIIFVHKTRRTIILFLFRTSYYFFLVSITITISSIIIVKIIVWSKRISRVSSISVILLNQPSFLVSYKLSCLFTKIIIIARIIFIFFILVLISICFISISILIIAFIFVKSCARIIVWYWILPIYIAVWTIILIIIIEISSTSVNRFLFYLWKSFIISKFALFCLNCAYWFIYWNTWLSWGFYLTY